MNAYARLLCTCALTLASLFPAAASADTRFIYLTRHVEKAGTGTDPALNAEGRIRAQTSRQRSGRPASHHDCRPYKPGNAESCIVPHPRAGTWHIGLKAYAAFSGVVLDVAAAP